MDFVANTTFDDIGDTVVHESKRMILDVIGCALGGYMTDLGSIAVNLARSLGGKPEATIVGSGDKTSCVEAARANRRMANALDADDTFPTVLHHGATTVSAALAACERGHNSGKDLIASVAVGFDIGARFSISVGPPGVDPKTQDFAGSRSGGWHLAQALASAGAAAKGLGLSPEQIAYAFGMACAEASVGQVTQRRSARMQNYKLPAGETVGIMAGLLAKMGMVTDDAILDGEFGIWRLTGASKCDFDLLVGGLGEKWYLPDTTYKPWPCCRALQPPLTAFVKVLEENGLKAEEIEEVLALPRMGIAAQPRFTNKNPVGMIDCEFSLAHAFAMAAFKVKPGPEWYAPEIMNDIRVQKFRQKVNLELGPNPTDGREWMKDGHYTKWPATVEVKARGKTYRASTEYAKGDPWTRETYLTDEELKTKFRNMATPMGGVSESWQRQVEEIINMVYELEKIPQITELTRLLSR